MKWIAPNRHSSVLLISISLAIGLLSVLQYTTTTIHAANHVTVSDVFQLSKQQFISPKPDSPVDKQLIAAENAKKAKNSLPDVQNVTSISHHPKRPNYYMVFSSSCSPQQHWESLVFFYHAYKVGQPGNVTRILSGCTDNEKTEADDFFDKYIKPMSDRFHLHHTKDFSTVKKLKGNQSYKYMNKPFGLRDWMENALGLSENREIDPEVADSIVMLLDPDMVLLRPLVHDFTNEDVEWVEKDPASKVVKTGHPIAQQDGYLNSKWVKLDFSHVTNQSVGDFIPAPHPNEGKLHWNSGPPYLAVVADMYRIAVKWTEYAPRVLDIQHDIFAEMVGLIIATVQLELPFTFIRSLVVSTTETKEREGWSYVDALPDDQVCNPELPARLPVGLHYCKRYMLGKWFFSKYRLKKNIMDCDKALILPPPPDMSYLDFDYAEVPPRADLRKDSKDDRVQIGQKRAKREAFMLCRLMNAVNEALRYHKQQKCGSDANLEETYSVHDDPLSF